MSSYSPGNYVRTMENVATYSEARSEYTKQLATFIVPSLVLWFQQAWQRNAHNRQQCLALFQSECEEIARWNSDRIHDEVRVLIERTGCDYMEELMTAVFVAHTKVLTAVRLSSREKKLSITVPKLDHFIHRIFREASRSFWKSAFLFMDNGSVVERQKNILQIEALATEAIGAAVRSLLPVKQILKDYMEGEHEEIEDEAIEVPPLQQQPEKTETEETVKAESATPETKPTIPVSTQSPVSSEPSTLPAQIESTKTPLPTPIAAHPSPPAIVNIDTEPTVTFSAYDDIYDESADGPTLEYRPKDDSDEYSEGNRSSGVQIHENSSRSLSIEDDFVDLEPVPKAHAPPMSDKITDDEIIDL